MVEITSICVFCGSGDGTNPSYREAAVTLGRDIAHHGVRLVYGGGSVGLMGTVAKAVLSHGGQVTGIIPRFLVEREEMLTGVDDLVITEDMHERKKLMFDRSDAFVALPGGIGTLEEVVEQMTWAQLGRHRKPVLLADIAGFWSPLIALLDHMAGEAFIRPGFDVPYLVADEAADILPALMESVRDLDRTELEGDPVPMARV